MPASTMWRMCTKSPQSRSACASVGRRRADQHERQRHRGLAGEPALTRARRAQEVVAGDAVGRGGRDERRRRTRRRRGCRTRAARAAGRAGRGTRCATTSPRSTPGQREHLATRSRGVVLGRRPRSSPGTGPGSRGLPCRPSLAHEPSTRRAHRQRVDLAQLGEALRAAFRRDLRVDRHDCGALAVVVDR